MKGGGEPREHLAEEVLQRGHCKCKGPEQVHAELGRRPARPVRLELSE